MSLLGPEFEKILHDIIDPYVTEKNIEIAKLEQRLKLADTKNTNLQMLLDAAHNTITSLEQMLDELNDETQYLQ